MIILRDIKHSDRYLKLSVDVMHNDTNITAAIYPAANSISDDDTTFTIKYFDKLTDKTMVNTYNKSEYCYKTSYYGITVPQSKYWDHIKSLDTLLSEVQQHDLPIIISLKKLTNEHGLFNTVLLPKHDSPDGYTTLSIANDGYVYNGDAVYSKEYSEAYGLSLPFNEGISIMLYLLDVDKIQSEVHKVLKTASVNKDELNMSFGTDKLKPSDFNIYSSMKERMKLHE